MKKTDIKLEDIERLEDAIKKFKIKEKNKIYIMALDSFFYIKAPLKDDFEIYEFFKKFNEVQLAFYYFKTKDENALKYLELKDIKTYIKGCDLIEEGFIEGEIIGKILKSVLKEKILNKGSLASREKEMEFVKNNFKL